MDNFLTLCVIGNTTVLAMDGIFSDSDTNNLLNNFNSAFTYIFIGEMGLKIFAFGLIGRKILGFFYQILGYLRDRMNIFDGCIVSLSIIEMTVMTKGNKAVSAFRAVRIFRTFRVLRVTRLLRTLAFMQVIIGVISRTLSGFIYIALLLLLFIIIYTLMG